MFAAGLQKQWPGNAMTPLGQEATFTTGVGHILSGGAELAYGRKNSRVEVE